MENLTHKMALPMGRGDLEANNNIGDSQLKAIYDSYGGRIYTLCLRLLANEKAAESATVNVFVQFSKEKLDHDDARTLSRLRELAISASIARMRGKSEAMLRRLMRKARRWLPKLRRSA